MDNITAASRDQMQFYVLYIGNVQLAENFILTDVLFIPMFAYNMFSISYLIVGTFYSINLSTNTC